MAYSTRTQAEAAWSAMRDPARPYGVIGYTDQDKRYYMVPYTTLHATRESATAQAQAIWGADWDVKRGRVQLSVGVIVRGM